MSVRFRTIRWDRVLIALCTQRDFLEPKAILQVANREKLIANLKEVFRWAKTAELPLVSFVESHRPSEPLNGFPLHCIDGSTGQEKLPFSLLSPWGMVETDNYLSLPPNLDEHYRQLIFRKRTRDVLSNPKADRFLTQLEANDIIIFGVGLERAIKSLALGLLARHKPVTVITDACGYWSNGDGDLSLRQLSAKGIRLVTTEQITTEEPPKRTRTYKRVVRNRHHPSNSSSAHRTRSDVTEH
jgi:nicotinamidase-related amidase